MKLSNLINSEIEVVIDFRGYEIALAVRPDLYTIKDKTDLDEAIKNDDIDGVFGYICKGLVDWYVKVGENREEITDDAGEPLALTPQNLQGLLPESFVNQILERIERLKASTMGKPTPPLRLASSSARSAK